MKLIPILVAALVLAACEGKAPPDTVQSLIANPKRLAELRAQCRQDRVKVGEAPCNAVGEATTRRFLGEGRGSAAAPLDPASSSGESEHLPSAQEGGTP